MINELRTTHMNNDHDDSTPMQDEKIVHYSFKVGENLFKKIEKNLHLLKYLDHNSHSKQRWIVEALTEKLNHELKTPPDDIPRERQLTVRINDVLNKKIEKRTEFIKKFRNSYSKKQWVIEAIHEKLDREAEKTRKLLQEVTDSAEN